MMRRYNQHILSVIAEIENYEVKIDEQILPVGKVGISGKAVAMGKEQAHTICAAMPSHTNSGTILEHNLKDYVGLWKLERHGDLGWYPRPFVVIIRALGAVALPVILA